MTINVGVFGAAGYAGQELIDLLSTHPEMTVKFAVSDRQSGESVNGNGLNYIAQADVDWTSADLVFLCTPHGVSAPLAAHALDAGAKVVDLSADLRLKTTDAFQQWYQQEHPVPALLPTQYGLPEINRHFLSNVDIISNPGCYPTATLLALAPLAKGGALKPGAPIVVDAKSGVTGAGVTPKPGTHFVEVYGDLKPYNIGRAHRHIGEMEQELKAMNPDAGTIIFTPHLLPVDRGILNTVYIPVTDGWTPAQIRDLFEASYSAEPLVDVLPDGQTARLKDAVRTNKGVISLHFPTPDVVLVVSVIDNLRKGASSQAIQNANILFELPETMGVL
ncbi:MAG: N-acetyl-gamma-glutamyl-phosphate reductase [Chloroflexi bacterium]|nr:N-acetyl-gamma-glutamyl-phosphate reductase [Chloroflexota bacterium]